MVETKATVSKGVWYKVLGHDGEACSGGRGQWHLPKKGKPGEWMPKVPGKVRACNNGYHLVRGDRLTEWVNDDSYAIYTAEGKGTFDSQSDKTAFAQARVLKLVGLVDDEFHTLEYQIEYDLNDLPVKDKLEALTNTAKWIKKREAIKKAHEKKLDVLAAQIKKVYHHFEYDIRELHPFIVGWLSAQPKNVLKLVQHSEDEQQLSDDHLDYLVAQVSG